VISRTATDPLEERAMRKHSILIFASTGLLVAALAPPQAIAESDNGLYQVRTGSNTKGVAGAIPEASAARAEAFSVLTHDRNLRRLGGSTSSAAAVSEDVDVDGDGVGDVAVIVDNGRIIVPARPANPLELQAGMRIRFTPTAADTFHVELATGQALDPGVGATLLLSDDDFEPVPISTPFPYLGGTHDTAFVGSDGHITFGAGDGSSENRDAARHIGGPPRLSPLLTDLNPDCRGTVHADARLDRLVVTWQNVVHFDRGASNGCGPEQPGNTLQAVLHANGTIDFVYGALDRALIGTPATGVTGIAEGNSEGPLNEIDLVTGLPADLTAGAIFEEFTPASRETFDTRELGKEFYRSHEDKFDQLVMFTEGAVGGPPGALAFHSSVQNQTEGLAFPLHDRSAEFGSAGELESFIWMKGITAWAGSTEAQYIDPKVHDLRAEAVPFFGAFFTPVSQFPEFFGFVDITGPGNQTGYAHHGRLLMNSNPVASTIGVGSPLYSLNSPVSVMFQEADHRWGAFVEFRHPTKGFTFPETFDLLGRGFSHWSTFFNTSVVGSPLAQADGNPRFSGMEGNALVQLESVNGKLRDKNDPARIVADPKGELTRGLKSCTQQGKGMFLTEPDELVDGATELDQYLMGVRTAEEVAPFWYVDEPTSPLDGRTLDEPFPRDFLRGTVFNLDDIAFCGSRVDLTVDDITAVGDRFGLPNGERVPAIGDENDLGPVAACHAENLGGGLGPCADVKTMAFVLLVRDGAPTSETHLPSIKRTNEFRKAWQTYTNGPALGGRNADGKVRPPDHPDFIPKFDTSLQPGVY